MKIRSITYFFNPGWPPDKKRWRQAGRFLRDARAAFEQAGYEVQTLRLATISFARLLDDQALDQLPEMAQDFERRLPETGADYIALGPALIETPRSYALLPDAIAATENVFFSGEMASRAKGLSLPAVRACARVITACSGIQPDGFANLRFAALGNVPAGAPFFPAAYHEDTAPSFALALEAADLAVSAFRQAADVSSGQQALTAAIESHARQLTRTADLLKYKYNLRFGGMDFSLAPFPQDDLSLGTAFEALGVPQLGRHGSLAAAAILADAIDRARFLRAGFSGLMLPVLEDATLARRAAEGTLGLKDLLAFSAVCGTGLDTIPLPGDVSAAALSPLLLDLAALSLRLDKPLTARLMPIPGKQAGDPTGFDFPFFANSRVLPLSSRPLEAALGGDGRFTLSPRPRDV